MTRLRGALLAAAMAAVALVASASSHASAGGGAGEEARAEELYTTGCVSCHGPEGEGVPGRGPTLQRSGAAGAYYYLETGRMPLSDIDEQPKRKEPPYSEEEIRLLVDYVASLGAGPAIPIVNLRNTDLGRGGELFRANCAACHAAAGIGGALSYGRAAPSLRHSEPLVIASAVRIGPGEMPAFRSDILSRNELQDIISYILHLQRGDNPGGASLGGAGPLPEGFVGWVFGIGPLVLASLWIGRREVRRRRVA